MSATAARLAELGSHARAADRSPAIASLWQLTCCPAGVCGPGAQRACILAPEVTLNPVVITGAVFANVLFDAIFRKPSPSPLHMTAGSVSVSVRDDMRFLRSADDDDEDAAPSALTDVAI